MTTTILPILLTLLCFLGLHNTTFAQQIPSSEEGVDLYPVYKANQPNAYIDSIVYQGPFVIFCIRFEKNIAEKKHHIASVHSKKSWRAYTGVGYRRPLVVRNIQQNGVLVAKAVRDKPLTIPLEANGDSEVAVITCQYQFLRHTFGDRNAGMVMPIDPKDPSKGEEVLFTAVKVRKSNFHHPISPALLAAYEKDYAWCDRATSKKARITINEKSIQPSWKDMPSSSASWAALPYKVHSYNKDFHFLEGVQHTPTSTIFKITVYGGSRSAFSLHHHKRDRFYIKAKGKKIPMQTIKNICVNEALVKEELTATQKMTVEDVHTPYLLSFEVHFERLPDNIGSFDLLEIYKDYQEKYAFNFYEVGAVVE